MDSQGSNQRLGRRLISDAGMASAALNWDQTCGGEGQAELVVDVTPLQLLRNR